MNTYDIVKERIISLLDRGIVPWRRLAEAAPFDSPVYAAEELIAEMSAAYLCAEAGISPAVVENQPAYIEGWLARLKGEKRFIVIAAAIAQSSADYILGRSPSLGRSSSGRAYETG